MAIRSLRPQLDGRTLRFSPGLLVTKSADAVYRIIFLHIVLWRWKCPPLFLRHFVLVPRHEPFSDYFWNNKWRRRRPFIFWWLDFRLFKLSRASLESRNECHILYRHSVSRRRLLLNVYKVLFLAFLAFLCSAVTSSLRIVPSFCGPPLTFFPGGFVWRQEDEEEEEEDLTAGILFPTLVSSLK